MGTIIGISYDIMSESKRNLNRARDASEAEKISLNSAKITLEDTGSSRLRMSASAISDQVGKVNARLEKIERVTTNIDYAVRRFQEVDEGCASRIKKTGLDFRRGVGLLNTKEKFSVDPFGSVMSGGEKAWDYTRKGVSGAWDKTSEWVGNVWDGAGNKVDYVAGVIDRHKESAATIGLEAASVGFCIATIAGLCAATITIGPAILIGIAALGIAYSVNTILNSGAKISQSEKSGESEEKSAGFNLIRDKFIKPVFNLDDEQSQNWYDRSSTFVNVLNIGGGGYATVKAVKEAKVAASIIKTSVKEVPRLEKALIKVTSKAVKATTMSSKAGRLKKVLDVTNNLKKYNSAPAALKKGIINIFQGGGGIIDTTACGIIEETYKDPFKINNNLIQRKNIPVFQ